MPSLFIIHPYIYIVAWRDYIATLPWKKYHGFQNTRNYVPKPSNFYNVICFYKSEGLHCEAPILHGEFVV